jgi:hypothetical protein
MDPGSFQKQFFDQMETVFVEKIGEMLKDPDFLEKVSKGMGAGLESKKKADSMSKAYLEKMNMPTRDDISKILQYLQQIESKIIDLEEKIEDLQDEVAELKKKPAAKTSTSLTAPKGRTKKNG